MDNIDTRDTQLSSAEPSTSSTINKSTGVNDDGDFVSDCQVPSPTIVTSGRSHAQPAAVPSLAAVAVGGREVDDCWLDELIELCSGD